MGFHKRSLSVCRCCKRRKSSSWQQAGLVQWYLYDVLLDDLPLWDGDVLWGTPTAAQPCKGTAPGQRKRAAERHLHGLPARHLPPFPCLPLQTLDSLKKTQQWGSEVRAPEPKRMGCLAFSTCTINHRYDTKLMTNCNNTMNVHFGPVAQKEKDVRCFSRIVYMWYVFRRGY